MARRTARQFLPGISSPVPQRAAPEVDPRVLLRIAMRMVFQVALSVILAVPSGTALQTTVQVTVGIGLQIASKIASKMTLGMSVRTTPGTVPRVTPSAVAAATLTASVPLSYPPSGPVTRIILSSIMRAEAATAWFCGEWHCVRDSRLRAEPTMLRSEGLTERGIDSCRSISTAFLKVAETTQPVRPSVTAWFKPSGALTSNRTSTKPSSTAWRSSYSRIRPSGLNASIAGPAVRQAPRCRSSGSEPRWGGPGLGTSAGL
jgi:hypothetical protein